MPKCIYLGNDMWDCGHVDNIGYNCDCDCPNHEHDGPEQESESSKHCDAGWMNDVRFGDGE